MSDPEGTTWPGRDRRPSDRRQGTASARDRGAVLLVVALSLSVTTVGCLPIPHMQQESPKLVGQVRLDDASVAGVTVMLDVNKPDCGGTSATVQTDAEGRYAFPAQRYFTPVFAFGDRFDQWTVCTQIRGRSFTNHGRGPWGGPPNQRLDIEASTTTGDSPGAPATSAPPGR